MLTSAPVRGNHVTACPSTMQCCHILPNGAPPLISRRRPPAAVASFHRICNLLLCLRCYSSRNTALSLGCRPACRPRTVHLLAVKLCPALDPRAAVASIPTLPYPTHTLPYLTLILVLQWHPSSRGRAAWRTAPRWTATPRSATSARSWSSPCCGRSRAAR